MTVHENKRSKTKLFSVMTGIVLVCLVALPRLVSTANVPPVAPGSLSQSPESSRDELFLFTSFQGPELDYSVFRHTSQRHASLGCTACHQRRDNSATPTFPGHKACTSCHLTQFVTPSVPMCAICHTDINGSNPPLKAFPVSFKESFNMKFDHAQHMTGAARPRNGCASCHDRALQHGVGLSIPAGIGAHNQCYVCHTPTSQSAAGREIASCGICHSQERYGRTSTNARAFRLSFSHAKHGPRQRLECVSCHTLAAGLPQGRQVRSPAAAEHFPPARGQSCLSCHDGKRSFGGDLAFADCKRCHAGPTFR